MHVGDTIFIFCLALIIFGPKKLPEIGRQIGKLMVEFRRASNEFKMQIEEELRASEEAERQKEITAETTMMPIPASGSGTETAKEAVSSTVPLIAPPSTGLPVNHSFSADEFSGPQDHFPAMALSEGAEISLETVSGRSETANGFNAGLNTASNGVIAEAPAVSTESFAVMASGELQPGETSPAGGELQPGESQPQAERVDAPVHHG